MELEKEKNENRRKSRRKSSYKNRYKKSFNSKMLEVGFDIMATRTDGSASAFVLGRVLVFKIEFIFSNKSKREHT